MVLGIPLGWFEISSTRLSRSLVGRPRPFDYPSPIPYRGPATPRKVAFPRFRLFPVRSPLLGESRLISFPPGTEMFHFPGLASAAYVFSGRYPDVTRDGLPHSEIPGSKPVGGSPGLIAACYVLHRLLTPRHPPYALQSLTVNPLPLNTPALSQRSCLYPVAIFSCQRTASLASASNIENCKLKIVNFKAAESAVLQFQIYNFQFSMSILTGGGERNRTADPLLAKQVLSRLSYTPDNRQFEIYNFKFEISNFRFLGGPRSN